MDDFLIVGVGGVGRHIAEQFLTVPEWRVRWNLLGFVDEDPVLHGRMVDNLRVLGGVEALREMMPCSVIVAVARPERKRQLVRQIGHLGDLEYPSLIHPRAWVAESAEIGQGVVIYPGVNINHHACVGDFVTINMGCVLGHDVHVEAYSSIAPQVGLAGHTALGKGVDFGIGGCTIQNCRIGAWSVVGAGAVVIGDLPPNVTAVGVPAQVIETRQDGWHLS